MRGERIMPHMRHEDTAGLTTWVAEADQKRRGKMDDSATRRQIGKKYTE